MIALSSLSFKCLDFFLEGSRESLLDVYVMASMLGLSSFERRGDFKIRLHIKQ